MKEDLLKIINTYGVNAQQRQFAEEVFELQEAITQHELKESVSYEIPITEIVETREHIAEEIADVTIMLKQFRVYYNVSDKTTNTIMRKKIQRQLERIKNEVKE